FSDCHAGPALSAIEIVRLCSRLIPECLWSQSPKEVGMKFRVFLMLGIVAFGGKSYGQSSSGSMTGIISGPNGAAVADAPIHAKNKATDAVARTMSKPDGRYTLTNLTAGTYEISINMPCC